MVREYCDENLEFYLEVDDYKHLTSSESQLRTAKRIYRTYIADRGPREVGLDV